MVGVESRKLTLKLACLNAFFVVSQSIKGHLRRGKRHAGYANEGTFGQVEAIGKGERLLYNATMTDWKSVSKQGASRLADDVDNAYLVSWV